MEQPALSIRKTTIADLELLQKICKEAYSQNFHHHWEPGGLDNYLRDSFGPKVLTTELKGRTMQYFVAFAGDEPVAFMKLNLAPNGPEQDPEKDIELEKIYVLPGYKGLKIGNSLLDTAFKLAAERGKAIMWLSVIDTNKDAISFYSKLGFQFHSETRIDYPGFKEELKGAWRMFLNLSARLPDA